MKLARGVVASWLVAACSSAAPAPSGVVGGSGSAAAAPLAPVTATLAVDAAVLADGCAGGDADVDAKASADSLVYDPNLCQASNVQLALVASATGAPAQVVITEIAVLDRAGTRLGTMTARAPLVWRDHAYQAWDATLRPGEALRLSVPTSAPPWSAMPGGRTGAGLFQVEVTITVGGVAVTARSAASIGPEPMMDT